MGVLKNPLTIGVISALIVILLAVIDGNRRGSPVGGTNVGKLGATVTAVVSGVVYLATMLHRTNKQLNGGGGDSGGNIGGNIGPEFDVDTKLPQF